MPKGTTSTSEISGSHESFIVLKMNAVCTSEKLFTLTKLHSVMSQEAVIFKLYLVKIVSVPTPKFLRFV
jgi:hypothetical protein